MQLILAISPLISFLSLICLNLLDKKFIWNKDAFSELDDLKKFKIPFRIVIFLLILAESIFIYLNFSLRWQMFLPGVLLLMALPYHAKSTTHKIFAALSFFVTFFIFAGISMNLGFVQIALVALMFSFGAGAILSTIFKVKIPYWLFEGMVMILMTVWNITVLV